MIGLKGIARSWVYTLSQSKVWGRSIVNYLIMLIQATTFGLLNSIGGVFYYKITVPCSTPVSNVSVPFGDQTKMLIVGSSGSTSMTPLLIRDNPSVNPTTGRNFLPVYAPVNMFTDIGTLEVSNVGLFSQAFMNLFGEVDGGSNWVNYNHYATSPSQINGDSMRGPYAKVQLRTNTSESFELHAVNVDYSFSRLDSRLTQNA